MTKERAAHFELREGPLAVSFPLLVPRPRHRARRPLRRKVSDWNHKSTAGGRNTSTFQYLPSTLFGTGRPVRPKPFLLIHSLPARFSSPEATTGGFAYAPAPLSLLAEPPRPSWCQLPSTTFRLHFHTTAAVSPSRPLIRYPLDHRSLSLPDGPPLTGAPLRPGRPEAQT